MKKLCLFFSLCFSLSAAAQDVIVMKDGSTILSKVLEVNPGDVKYKKFSNQGGPTYTINKADIMCINYENGEKDTFEGAGSQAANESNVASNNSSSTPRYIEKEPAENNSKLIELYRGEIHFGTTASNKDAKYMFPIMAVSDSSILSNDEVQMSFVPDIIYDDNRNTYFLRNSIEIKNKTNSIIYIDLANTFRIHSEYWYESYYDTEQTTVSQGNSTGAGVGLGGITNVLGVGGVVGSLANSVTVGGSSQNSVATTYTKERIKAIPPHATANLTEYKSVKIKNNEYKDISDLERWGAGGYYFSVHRRDVKKNGHVFYDEDNTPDKIKYIITYSSSPVFSTYSMLNATVYVRCIVGGFTFDRYWGREGRKEIIRSIQKYVPNFLENPFILVGECSALSK